MKITNILSRKSLVWGQPDAVPNNTGKAVQICIQGVLLLCIPVLFWLMPEYYQGLVEGLVEVLIFWILCFATLLMSFLRDTFSSNFKLQGVRADASGIRIAYSFTPHTAENYVPKKIFVEWSDVIRISKPLGGGEYGSFFVVVKCSNTATNK